MLNHDPGRTSESILFEIIGQLYQHAGYSFRLANRQVEVEYWSGVRHTGLTISADVTADQWADLIDSSGARTLYPHDTDTVAYIKLLTVHVDEQLARMEPASEHHLMLTPSGMTLMSGEAAVNGK